MGGGGGEEKRKEGKRKGGGGIQGVRNSMEGARDASSRISPRANPFFERNFRAAARFGAHVSRHNSREMTFRQWMLVNERNASPVIRAWDKIPRPSLSLGFVNTTSIPSPPISPSSLLLCTRARTCRVGQLSIAVVALAPLWRQLFPPWKMHTVYVSPLSLNKTRNFYLLFIPGFSPPSSPPTRSLVTRNVTSKSFGIRSQSVQFPFIREGGGFIRRWIFITLHKLRERIRAFAKSMKFRFCYWLRTESSRGLSKNLG